MIVAENFFFRTEADLKSNTPHELYSVITELRIADLSLIKKRGRVRVDCLTTQNRTPDS